MAEHAVTRDAVAFLRRQIAALETCRPGLAAPEDGGGPGGRLATGAAGFDRALGGGIERDALCEIHAGEVRDAGAASGLVLGLASLAIAAAPQGALLWIAARESVREAGFPYAEGLEQAFAIAPERIVLAHTRTGRDALWIAGEAAGIARLAAIVLELHGEPAGLDLTATRRLHRQARAAGRPVFLLRLSARPQPTAAPLRLGVAPARAAPRRILGEALPGSLGAPAFLVTVQKCRANPGGQFILEWDCHDHRFRMREAALSVPVVSPSADRPDSAPAVRPLLAYGPGGRRRAG